MGGLCLRRELLLCCDERAKGRVTGLEEDVKTGVTSGVHGSGVLWRDCLWLVYGA